MTELEERICEVFRTVDRYPAVRMNTVTLRRALRELMTVGLLAGRRFCVVGGQRVHGGGPGGCRLGADAGAVWRCAMISATENLWFRGLDAVLLARLREQAPDFGPDIGFRALDARFISECWLLSSIGGWFVESQNHREHYRAVGYLIDQGWVTLRMHYAPVFPDGAVAFEITDEGLARLERSSRGTDGSEAVVAARRVRQWYRDRTAQPRVSRG